MSFTESLTKSEENENDELAEIDPSEDALLAAFDAPADPYEAARPALRQQVGPNVFATKHAGLKHSKVEIDIDAKLSCGLSRRELNQLKAAGVPKPDYVPWNEWSGPRKLNHRHYLLAHLAALGYRNAEIAAATGFAPATTSELLGKPEIQAQIQLIREVELQGTGVTQILDRMSSQAVRVYDQILNSPGEKNSLKFQVASDILDRKLGKPKIAVKHEGSLLSDFYELLQKQDELKRTLIAEKAQSGEYARADLAREIAELRENQESAKTISDDQLIPPTEPSDALAALEDETAARWLKENL